MGLILTTKSIHDYSVTVSFVEFALLVSNTKTRLMKGLNIDLPLIHFNSNNTYFFFGSTLFDSLTQSKRKLVTFGVTYNSVIDLHLLRKHENVGKLIRKFGYMQNTSLLLNSFCFFKVY